MAFNPNEQYVAGTEETKLRYEASGVSPKTFASGSGTIAKLQPVTFNTSTAKWQAWSGKHYEINTITPSGIVSGGDWLITVNGISTAAIAYNASAAVIQAAIELLQEVDAGDVVVTGGPLSATGPVVPVVLTWGGNYLHKSVTVAINPSGLTGGGSAAIAETQAGVNTTGVRGFAFEDITLDSDEEVLGNVIMAGTIHYDDIVLPAGSTEAELQAQLRSGLRELGFKIDGLTQFH